MSSVNSPLKSFLKLLINFDASCGTQSNYSSIRGSSVLRHFSLAYFALGKSYLLYRLKSLRKVIPLLSSLYSIKSLNSAVHFSKFNSLPKSYFNCSFSKRIIPSDFLARYISSKFLSILKKIKL